MKILFAVESLTKGGRERRIIELLKGFQKYDDVQCEVVIFRDIVEYEEFYTLGVPLHILKRKKAKDFSIFSKFNKLLNEVKPDIIHSWGGMSSIYTLPIARFKGIKTINAMITNSRADFLSENWIRSRLTFPFSNVIASNSKAGLKAYLAPRRRSVLIYNGFSGERLNNLKPVDEIRSSLGIKTPIIVAMVAAFQPRKDYTTYITAAVNILKTRNDVTFLAVGNGGLLDDFKKIIPKDLKSKFIFTGRRDDVESIMNAVDIGVLTTNSKGGFAEGISNAILEFMAVAKPVIATNEGGTPEIINDGVTGFLVPDSDTKALENKIVYLLNNPEKIIEMGKKGKEIVFESFTIECMITKTYKVYKNLLSK